MAPQIIDTESVFTTEPLRVYETEGTWASPPRILDSNSQVFRHNLRRFFKAAFNQWYLTTRQSNKNLSSFLLSTSKVGNTKAAELIRQVEAMRTLSDNWNGYGSARPNDISIQLAELVVLSAAAKLTPTRVVPSAQGGVAVYFVRAQRHGDIECLNTGDITTTTAMQGQLPNVWEIRPGEIKGAIDTIAKFLEP